MQRKKAILVHTIKREPLDIAWRPMLAADELEYANARLAQIRMPYRWKWLDNVTTLTGSVDMREESDNASVQLRPGVHSC